MATPQTQRDSAVIGESYPTLPRPRHRSIALPVWMKWGMCLLMIYAVIGAFAVPGTQNFGGNGNYGRIMFFHVPVSILTYIAYIVSTVYAVHYLTKNPDLRTDAKSAIAMELGFMLCILATVTGSIFAHTQWGSYWNWDPREISIVVMLLLYASYLVLRGAAAERPVTRARLSAVYAIVAVIPATFLIWVVPRIPALQSLHPTTVLTTREGMSATYRMVFYPSLLAFTLLFVWLFQMRLRVYDLAARRQK